ncbi:MAG: DNA methyltransferase [Anaerolineales bacterium]
MASIQLPLSGLDIEKATARGQQLENASNSLGYEDRAVHDWYRFVLSFPPHLVRQYMKDFGLAKGQVVCDPFCGTGTTLVEARLGGFESVGIEAIPVSHFASKAKLNWGADPDELRGDATKIAEQTRTALQEQGILDDWDCSAKADEVGLRKLDDKRTKLLIKDSISPLPLHKTLMLLDNLSAYEGKPHYDHLRLAIANSLVGSISNLRFGTEVGVGKIKTDTPVLDPWLNVVSEMALDIGRLTSSNWPEAKVFLSDARRIDEILEPKSIDAVITSPPYPNEKDYTRTTRLETVLLGFAESMKDVRDFKKQLVRSNTRGVYKDDTDDEWVSKYSKILSIAKAIEDKRKELGKTSGFERQYHRVTKLYFGGMLRHLSGLRNVLRPGAHLAYVVGDQASYLRVMIRTGQLLAEIASDLGYEVLRIDLFRKRFATATKEELREEVVVLKWNG